MPLPNSNAVEKMEAARGLSTRMTKYVRSGGITKLLRGLQDNYVASNNNNMTKKVEDGGDEPHQGQDKGYCKQAEGQILISRFHLITK